MSYEYDLYDDDHDDEVFYHLIPADFSNAVDDFDTWKPIFSEENYESRLQTEAELMIGLEALREAVNILVEDLYDLEENLEHNIERVDLYLSIINGPQWL